MMDGVSLVFGNLAQKLKLKSAEQEAFIKAKECS